MMVVFVDAQKIYAYKNKTPSWDMHLVSLALNKKWVGVCSKNRAFHCYTNTYAYIYIQRYPNTCKYLRTG